MPQRFLRRLIQTFVRPQWPASPVTVRHALPSWLYSADDESVQASDRLVELSVRIIDRARSVDLEPVSHRIPSSAIRYPDVWPGEHYKLLAAMVDVVQPQTVVEIGTAEGMSALCQKMFLPPNGRVVTFDIIPYAEYPGSLLMASDFDNQLEQKLDDLSQPEIFRKYADLIASADIIFVDAPKDGVFECKFLENLSTLSERQPRYVVLDDIRMLNMLKLWRKLDRPKLDLTSFGHWSGTGLIEWSRA